MVNDSDLAPYWVIENQDIIRWANKPKAPKFIKSVSSFISRHNHMTYKQRDIVSGMLADCEEQWIMLDKLRHAGFDMPILDSFRSAHDEYGNLTEKQFNVLKRIYNGKIGLGFEHTYGSYEP